MSHGIALLGAGLFAKSAHLPAIQAVSSQLSLLAIYSRSEKSASDLAESAGSGVEVYCDSSAREEGSQKDIKGDLDALLKREDVQTVVLALPITVQPEIIEKAWKAGKNVVSEKPVAKDVKEALRLIDLYEKEYKPKGLQWIVAEQFPYERLYVEAREIVASGEIGKIRSYSSEWFMGIDPKDHKYYNTPWRKTPEYQGGFLLDGGVHFMAGLRHILSGASLALTSVSATRHLVHDFLAPQDSLYGVLKSSDENVGGTFAISFAHEAPGTVSARYTIRGSKGVLTVDKSQVLVVVDKDGQEVRRSESPGDGVKQEFEAFAKALTMGRDSREAKDVDARSGPRATLKDLGAIEAALKSGQSGQWEKLQ